MKKILLILMLYVASVWSWELLAQVREFGRVGELQICTYIKLPNGELKPEPAKVQIFANSKEVTTIQTQVRDGKLFPARIINFNKGEWLLKWEFGGKPKEATIQRESLNPENLNIILNE